MYRATEIEALIGLALAKGTGDEVTAAITLAREQGMRLLEAKALTALAEIKEQQGDLGEALAAAGQALEMFREFGSCPVSGTLARSSGE